MRTLLAGLVVLVAAPSPVLAGLVVSSEEVAVSAEAAGQQAHPSVSSVDGGGFLVVWEDQRPSVAGRHVFARRFDSEGVALGTEFRVDPEGEANNGAPDVVAIDDGYVVVWRREAAIVGRTLDTNGTPSGSEFQVNTARGLSGDYYLGAPVLAGAHDGGFIVTWSSGSDPDIPFSTLDTDVFARRFDADSAPAGNDVLVSIPVDLSYERIEHKPDVVARPDGSFAVAWTGNNTHLFGRILDSSGATVGNIENIAAQGGRTGSRILASAQSEARALYFSRDPDDEARQSLRAIDISATGDLLSTPALLESEIEAEDPPADVREIAAAAIDGGRYAVVWTDADGGGGRESDILIRLYHASGYAASDVREAALSATGDQTDPEMALLEGGKVVIVWSSEHRAAGGDVFTRTFDIVAPECGDADENGLKSAADALHILQSAVGTRQCKPCGCDPDSSGAQSASDALLVLRASVGQAVELDCPNCPAGSPQSFNLTTPSPCFGTHLEIPRTAAELSLLDCEVDPRVRAQACDVEVSESAQALVFDARGCLIDDQPAFGCVSSGGSALAMVQGAQVACGCRCDEQCFKPRVCTTVGDDEVCSPERSLLAVPQAATLPTAVAPQPAASATQAAPTTFETVQEVSTTSTSSVTFCGTCCGPFDDFGDVALTNEVELTELLVRMEGDAQQACSWCTPIGHITTFGNTPALCVVDQDGFSGPLTTSCEGYGVVTGPATVLRALGRNFEPIDPAPSIEFTP